LAVLVCFGVLAETAKADEPGVLAADELEDLPKVQAFVPRIDQGRSLSAGLEAYGALAMLFTGGRNQSRAMAGGMLRVSWWYLQAGIVGEMSNTGEDTGLLAEKQERWTAVGGFVGALVPFYKWVDLDATCGLVSRTYRNSSVIYGPDGFTESGPSITWRIGISDRAGERLFGARVGGGFLGAFDTVTHSPAWERTYLTGSNDEVGVIRGTTLVGGASFGLYVAAGFELGGGVRTSAP
jgi:hypothetical protein